jgi:hypothetical protein
MPYLARLLSKIIGFFRHIKEAVTHALVLLAAGVFLVGILAFAYAFAAAVLVGALVLFVVVVLFVGIRNLVTR